MSSPRVVIERTIPIKATPAAVQSALADESLLPYIFPRITVRQIEDHWPEPGSRLNVSYHLAGLSLELSLVMLEHTASTHVKSLTARNIQFHKPAHGTIRYAWSEEDGATRLICRYEYEVPEDPLSQELERWMLRMINTETLEASLSNLKSLLETGR
jgi:hypothetical protein